MKKFSYRARDLNGGERTGQKRAETVEGVYAWLNGHGLIPLEVTPAFHTARSRGKAFVLKRPKHSDMASFCWQLSTMIEGGVTITEAIETIAEDIDSPAFKYTILEVCERIKRGETFSDSAAEFPEVFNRLFCAMILAGESSGSLPTILQRLAEYFSGRDKFNKKVQTALAYPLFVVGFVFVVLLIMMTMIIPKFRQIFTQMGEELPAFTQIFMNCYDMFMDNALLIVISLGTLVISLIVYGKTQRGYAKLSMLFLHLPLIGKLGTQAFVATFCKTMATLLSAGVSIIETFDILSEMTNNEVIKNAVIHSKERMVEGLSVSLAMSASSFFPTMVARMIQVGERSGSLPKVLDRASAYYETKMDTTITTLLNLLGPVVILAVGIIVLVVVVALYLPIFSMSPGAAAG
jgi:type II secretory pathway component PulF